jgi:hypothetical protein
MNQDIARVLDAIETAGTAGEAFDAVPETWGMFITGPDGVGEFACSLWPEGDDGVAQRVYDRGYTMGRGVTRLQAMTKAVTWMRRRIPALAA